MREWMGNYEKLLRRFPEYLEIARTLASPNLEDDLCVRIAIVGYSFYQPTAEWDRDNLRFVQERRSDEYSDVALSGHGEHAAAYALFACLGLGYLLGLFDSGGIDEAEFIRGEALLPGFLALHSTDLPIVSRSNLLA